MKYLLLACVVGLASCSQSAPKQATVLAQSPKLPAQQSTQPAEPQPPAATAETVAVMVEAVDLEGKPVPNMLPIATEQPNAFDSPVAKGALTDAAGKSSLSLTSGQHVYIRTWDPTRRVFANNYFVVIAGDANSSAETMTVVMVPGAQLEVALVGPDQKPAANTEVALMMFHPQKGPWWPDQAKSDGHGVVTFPAVPPGKYGIKLKAESGGQIELSDVALSPSGKTNLGIVTLQ